MRFLAVLTPVHVALAVVVEAILLGGIVSPRYVYAQAGVQEVKGFWAKGDATKWLGDVHPNSSESIVYRDYPLAIDQIRAEEQVNQAPPQNTEDKENAKEEALAPKAPPTPMSREEILAQFGSPDNPQLIKAQKDSPPAMQGLFAAINADDKELAWGYALALAKRQVEMQSVVSKATDYQILAMEALGMRPPAAAPKEGQPLDPTRAELQELMEKTRREQLQKVVNIDEQLQLNPEAVSAALNQEPALPIPVDPEGKVKVLIFFDARHYKVGEVVESLKPLKEPLSEIKDLQVLGLTRRTYSQKGLSLKSAELSFPFPLVNGEALALELRIQSYPTVVFLAATTQKTYRVEGVPTVDEMQRIVKVMRGGR
jgi:hypothetical protein